MVSIQRKRMPRSGIVLPPYPVCIGSIKADSWERQLHEYVRNGKYSKAKKLLKKGILPDSVNSEGQTPLFVASLLGLWKLVDLLLDYGSFPNHRCLDWSTPVHAAAFSCNQWIMGKLIDAGGDLRLHDEKSRRPYHWALMAGKDESAQMVEFIDGCFAQMYALIHPIHCKPMKNVTSHDLIRTGLQSQRNFSNSFLENHKNKHLLVKKTGCLGYGEFSFRCDGHLDLVSTVPLIEDKSIMQDDSRPIFSFAAGPHMTMTNLLWGYTEVTVKGVSEMTHKHCSNVRYVDLLIEEQRIISNLQHPLILQLLAMCISSTIEKTQLVFERVTFGSFYSILHRKRSDFPILHMETIVHLLLQTVDALMFLHWRGFIHCSFSSHAIQIVSAGCAKISHFEYMIQSNDDRTRRDVVYFPVPEQLYPWSSPEIVLGRSVTAKSDIYSLCVVIQESLTDCLPWNGLHGSAIKDLMASHHYLNVDPRLFKPYDSIASSGLQAKPEKRTITLQDIKYLLRNDLKNSLDDSVYASGISKVMEKGGSPQHSEQKCQIGLAEEVTAATYKSRNISSTESHTDTLDEIAKETGSVESDSLFSEDKGQSYAGNFDQQGIGSSSSFSSHISISETSPTSDSEDADYKVCSPKFQTLDDKLPSLQTYNKSKVDNLSQKFQQSKIFPCGTEQTNQWPENINTGKPLKKSTDEVDNMVQHFISQSYAERCAVGPPHWHYVPPDIASSSKTEFIEIQENPLKTQPESSEGDWNKATDEYSEQGNVCNSCKKKNLQSSAPSEITPKEVDGSSEAGYFTPELEISQTENSSQQTSDESNSTDAEDMQHTTSVFNVNTAQERRQIGSWTGDQTLNKNMSRVTTIPALNSSSLIDVEGLSSIYSELKSPTKHCNTPKSWEASARHSTPVSQAICSKLKSLKEQLESCETSCWTSMESHQSALSSMAFLTAHCDRNDVEKTFKTDAQDPYFSNQDLVCIVDSNEYSGADVNNKTDCECQSMDIASILNDTAKTSKCGKPEHGIQSFAAD